MAKSSEVFRKNVSDLAHKKGISIRALAIAIKLDPSQLAKILRGENDPSLDTLDKIANGLDVKPFELLSPPLDQGTLSAIERRLAALEAKPSAQALSESPHEPVDLLPELEKLGRELEREIGDPSLKKRGRKLGSG